jgi:hypothetical protein
MRGRTVVLVTHHFSLCLPSAVKVVELYQGEVRKEGPRLAFMDKRFSYLDIDEASEQTEEVEEMSEGELPGLGLGLDGALGEAETRAEGRVSLGTYMLYVRSAGAVTFTFTFILILLIRGVSLLEQVGI